MLREMLSLHWKASRWVLLPFLLLTFGLPLLVLRLIDQVAAADAAFGAQGSIYVMEMWAPFFPILAAIVGFAVALTGWAWDHRVGHVYALALPVSRARYATQKFLGGLVVLLVPVLALLAGIVLGRMLTTLPDGVQAYPLTFTARFLLASALTYALGFALAAGTMRTVIWLLAGAFLVVVFGTLLVEFLEGALGTSLWTPLELIFAALVDWPGPFHVFGGSWMLIDV